MAASRLWSGANGVMAALFALSAIVQLNDPDPLRWIFVYACAMAVCIAETRQATPWPAAVVVFVLALLATAWIARDLERAPVGRLFDQWEMRDTSVEETREVGGLLIVAMWMLFVTVAAWTRSRARRAEHTARHGETTP